MIRSRNAAKFSFEHKEISCFLKTAFKESENAMTKFTCLVDGEFGEISYLWKETGIVEFLDLTE